MRGVVDCVTVAIGRVSVAQSEEVPTVLLLIDVVIKKFLIKEQAMIDINLLHPPP